MKIDITRQEVERLRKVWNGGGGVQTMNREQQALYFIFKSYDVNRARQALEDDDRIEENEPFDGVFREAVRKAAEDLMRAGYRSKAAYMTLSAGLALPPDFDAMAARLKEEGPLSDGLLSREQVAEALRKIGKNTVAANPLQPIPAAPTEETPDEHEERKRRTQEQAAQLMEEQKRKEEMAALDAEWAKANDEEPEAGEPKTEDAPEDPFGDLGEGGDE